MEGTGSVRHRAAERLSVSLAGGPALDLELLAKDLRVGTWSALGGGNWTKRAELRTSVSQTHELTREDSWLATRTTQRCTSIVLSGEVPRRRSLRGFDLPVQSRCR
jgi:hypothetical protein